MPRFMAHTSMPLGHYGTRELQAGSMLPEGAKDPKTPFGNSMICGCPCVHCTLNPQLPLFEPLQSTRAQGTKFSGASELEEPSTQGLSILLHQ